MYSFVCCRISFSCIPVVTTCRGLLFCDFFCIASIRARQFCSSFVEEVLWSLCSHLNYGKWGKKLILNYVTVEGMGRNWLLYIESFIKMSFVSSDCFKFDRCDTYDLCVYRYAIFRNPNVLASLLFPLVAILSIILGTRENRAAVCEAL